jgi:glyoxylase-like metal-dependent hydrolase (beta-lactamase superfamily II)
MQAQNDPQFRADFWDRVFPGQVPAGELDVTVVDQRGFNLDGVSLVPVEVGHTDTDATTILHVPEMGLLVAGDVVYNGVHPYLTESVTGIDEWLAALDTAENLNPATVIAGHKDPPAFDNPSQIQATRQYLTDARRLLQSSGIRPGLLRGNASPTPQPAQPRRFVGRGHYAFSNGLN